MILFDPCVDQAQALDARMRQRLSHSLSYVIQACSSRIVVDPGFAQGLIYRIEQEPISPRIFGAYYDLVIAVETDAIESAQSLMDEILRCDDVDRGLQMLDLEDSRHDHWSDRICRLMDTDQESSLRLRPPPSDLSQKCRQAIEAAFQLLDASNPELAHEIRALVREIVLAVGPEEGGYLDFYGASNYMLWGAIVINAQNHDNVLEILQTLVHESAHCVLFGLGVDGALVEDDPSKRYASPLRADARPMIGVYHATYVSARIHQALMRLRDSGNVAGQDMPLVESELLSHVSNYCDGMETIRSHAKLTPLGESIMLGAERHMAGFQ